MNNRIEYAVHPAKDYSKEAPTLVEFTLQQTANGTLLLIADPVATKS